MTNRITPNTTVQSIQIEKAEAAFNKFCSGAETLGDALQISQQEYEALKHGECQLTIEQIDRLGELGFNIDALFNLNKNVI